MTELWMQIPNTDGFYEVSDQGRIRSYHVQGGKKTKLKTPKIITLSINGGGYLQKSIYCRSISKLMNLRVHRLVAECFIPNPANLECVNHIDGDKTNNHVLNLEWCTKSHNERHAQRLGLKNKAKGEECNKSHLTDGVVLEIFKSTLGTRKLGRIYGVNHSTVSNIKTGVTWNHITGMPIVPNKRNVSHL